MSKVKITKKTVKNIVAVLLAILISFGAIFGLVKLFSNNETAMKKVSPTVFSVGGLNVKGEYIDTDDTLYSELIECRGLTIEQDFESQSKYQVFYYDEDKDFIGRTDEFFQENYTLEKKYDTAKFCRIVINPMQLGDDSETFKIKFWEVLGYADDLTIKVYEKQNYVSKDLIRNAIGKNQLIGHVNYVNYFEDGDFIFSNCEVSKEDGTNYVLWFTASTEVNLACLNVSEIGSLKIDNTNNAITSEIIFISESGAFVSSFSVEQSNKSIVEVPTDAKYVLINYLISNNVSVKKYTLR